MPRLSLPAAGTAGRVAAAAAVVALTVWLGFANGGFFADSAGLAAALGCVALLLLVTLAGHPGAGLTGAGVVAAGGLAALASWTLLSASWSDAPARALIEYQRVLLYLTVFALFACLPRSATTARWLLRGLTAAFVILCAAGLSARALPGLLDVQVATVEERLTWPLGYWNAMGVLAALGLIGCVHLSADLAERAPVRVLAAAATPVLAGTLLLTLSRGGFVAAFIGLLVLVVFGRARGLPTALAAIAPVVVYVVLDGYGTDALLDDGYDVRSAATRDAGGQYAATIALACVLAAAIRALGVPLDARARRIRREPLGRELQVAVAAGVVVGVVVGGLAVGAPAWLGDQYDRFAEPAATVTADRTRLTEVGSNNRVDLWEVALDSWREAPLKGSGAGTFSKTWAREQPVDLYALDGHSLPFELLAELGVVGLALLAVTVLVALGMALARRARREDRVLWTAVIALTAAWAAHASVDWDWEMPVLQVGIFALLGTACARHTPRPAGRLAAARLPRIVGGLVLLLLAVQPIRVALSQDRLNDALRAFRGGDCTTTAERALSSIDALASRPEPFELLGYCDVRAGKRELAVRIMRAGLSRDPGSWELHYALALAQGVAGKDPRPQLRAARRAYPNGEVIADAQKRMRGRRPAVWRREALASPLVIPPGEADRRGR